MTGSWTERNHVVKGLDPVADAFEGTVYSDIVSMKGHSKIEFILYKGVGATGTSTLTVEASDDFAASNVTAVPFWSRRCANTADAQGTLTRRAAAGFATTAGSSEIYICEVNAEDLAETGYSNVRLKAVQVVDSPVLGGILIIASSPTFSRATQNTIIS